MQKKKHTIYLAKFLILKREFWFWTIYQVMNTNSSSVEKQIRLKAKNYCIKYNTVAWYKIEPLTY